MKQTLLCVGFQYKGHIQNAKGGILSSLVLIQKFLHIDLLLKIIE